VTGKSDRGLVVERVGDVLVLRIDRPDKLGALSRALLEALEEQVGTIRDDPTVAVVVLTGSGRGFIAGADIAEYHGVTSESFADYQYRSRRLFDGVAALDRPVIAAVNGYALGGGFELALACDIIIASSAARFGLPEVMLGLVPGGGGPQRLARRTSPAWVKEIAMTGRRVDPPEALARGVISRIVEPDDLMAEAMTLANDLAQLPWRAVRRMKGLIDESVDQSLGDALDVGQQALLELFETPDGREGITAFLDKRPARFTQSGRDTRPEGDA
jgi:enoyl-CoA hydratase/carnithine racemase